MQKINTQFREDEIVIMNHWDKNSKERVNTVYPKIGARLRLAHEENEQISITTEVIKYDGNIAVVSAISETSKGSFKGIGMASIDRDERIAPAILELAETRAIARSLRFAGYGVEFCSAEEISHLENGNSVQHQHDDSKAHLEPRQAIPIRNQGHTAHGEQIPANDNTRLTNKQLNYIVNLGSEIGLDSKSLDQASLQEFNVKFAYLSKRDASAFIDSLKRKAA